MYDVAIIGAGPAGATLARLLGDRYRVLLVDRRELGRAQDETLSRGLRPSPAKSCGGLLAPAAQRALAAQGLGVPGDVLSGPQLFAVRTIDAVTGVERLYQRHYLNVDREAFDRWLVSLVPDGTDGLFGRSLIALEPDTDGTTLLRFRPRAGEPSVARARTVVAADGAASLIRHQLFGTLPAPDRYVTIQATFASAGDEPYFGALFDDELTDFYGWSIPKGDTLLVGGAFRRGPGANARFERLLQRFTQAGFDLTRPLGRESAAVARPTKREQLLTGTDAVMLLGEAAGFMSPSSAEGISYALRSAEALATALEPGLEGASARYAREVRPLSLEIGGKFVKSATIYDPRIRALAMRSGLAAIRPPRRRVLAPVPRREPVRA